MKKFIDSAQYKTMTVVEAAKLYGIYKYFNTRFSCPRWYEEKYPIKDAIYQAHRIANVMLK